MVDAREYLPSNNTLKESIIHAAWLQTSINNTQVLGGADIGTEFDLNFTHHFTKTLAWQAWGSYVWTGSGVESENNTPNTLVETTPFGNLYATQWNGFSGQQTKNITAVGTDVSWNF